MRRTSFLAICMLFNKTAGLTQTLHAGLDGPSDLETDTDDDLRRPAAPPATQPEADLLQAGDPAELGYVDVRLAVAPTSLSILAC